MNHHPPQSPPPPHRDLSGRPIKQGDYVAYAASWGRCPVIKYGKVVTLPVVEAKSYHNDKDPIHKVQVVTVDRTWQKKWELQGTPISNPYPTPPEVDPACATLVTLSFTDRMLVVSDDQVPKEARKLLDAAWEVRMYCEEHDERHMGEGCPYCPKRKRKK